MGKKKEKITYIDDGRTIADMSGVAGGGTPRRTPGYPRAGLKEQLSTFFGAMKMMLLPTLAMAGFLAVIYAIAWFLFRVM